MIKVSTPKGMTLNDGKFYVPVKERILALRESQQTYSLMTEVKFLPEINGFMAKATLTILATGEVYIGHSVSYIGRGNMIQRINPAEDAETSAWGRALAAAGIGIADSLASFEEVDKSIREQAMTHSGKTIKDITDAVGELVEKTRPVNPIDAIPPDTYSDIKELDTEMPPKKVVAEGPPPQEKPNPNLPPEPGEEKTPLQELNEDLVEMNISPRKIPTSSKELRKGTTDLMRELFDKCLGYNVNVYEYPGRNNEKKAYRILNEVAKGPEVFEKWVTKEYGPQYAKLHLVSRVEDMNDEAPVPESKEDVEAQLKVRYKDAPPEIKQEINEARTFNGRTVQEMIAAQKLMDVGMAKDIREEHPATQEIAEIEKESKLNETQQKIQEEDDSFAPASAEVAAEVPGGINHNIKKSGNKYGIEVPSESERADPNTFYSFFLTLNKEGLTFDVLTKKYAASSYRDSNSDIEMFLRTAKTEDINQFINGF